MAVPDAPSTESRDWIDQAFNWALVAIGAYLLARHTYPAFHPLSFVFGIVLVAVGLGRWRTYTWASWGLIVVLAGMIGIRVWRMARGDFSGLGLLMTPCLGWAVWLEWKTIRARQRAQQKTKMVSLVLLERTPRELDTLILPHIIASVWPGDYTSRDDTAACFVVGEGALFMVRSPLGLFMIHCIGHPYFDHPEEFLPRVPDLRLRKCIEENRAWLSVDWMSASGDPAQDEACVYREIGKLVAALAGPDTQAVYHPDTGRFCSWTAEASASLAAGDGLSILEEETLAPVIPVDSGDDVLAQAAAEARRRWPEFVAALARRHPEQDFAVKTALTVDGTTEHIWIDVESVDGASVRGRLGNDPVDLGSMKRGDPVTIDISAVEDWMYVLTDQPVGGFSVAAVSAAAKRIREAGGGDGQA